MNIFVIGADGKFEPPFFAGDGPVFPPHDLMSYDDDQCRGILNRLGGGWLLQNRPRPTEHLKSDQAMQRAYFVADHPTHWFGFVRWEHSPNEDNNGYAMRGYLKKAGETRDDYEGRFKADMGSIRWEMAEVSGVPHVSRN